MALSIFSREENRLLNQSLTGFQEVVSVDTRGREPRHVNTEDAEKVWKYVCELLKIKGHNVAVCKICEKIMLWNSEGRIGLWGFAFFVYDTM